MDVTTWFAFAAASIVLLLIPGPTVLLVVSYALTQGKRVAVATAAGVALGDFTAMTLSLAGLGALLLDLGDAVHGAEVDRRRLSRSISASGCGAPSPRLPDVEDAPARLSRAASSATPSSSPRSTRRASPSSSPSCRSSSTTTRRCCRSW